MRARWKLGRLLAAMERAPGPGRGKKIRTLADSFLGFLKKLKLDEKTSRSAQRIGALPETELDKLLAEAHQGNQVEARTAAVGDGTACVREIAAIASSGRSALADR
jgi:hypothetical protein